MSYLYKVAKGDILLQSKHADVALEMGPDGWFLAFYNQPRKGKAIVVDYTPSDYPAVSVSIKANWKAKIQAERICRQEKLESHPF